MSLDIKHGMVRILGSDGITTSGAGFVATDDGLIITCAHVVQGAVVQGSDDQLSQFVELVLCATGEKRRARVAPCWWRPEDKEDVAVLCLEGALPSNVEALPLFRSGSSKDHPFETFGFPVNGPPDGLIGSGHILGEISYRDSPVLQLRSEEVTPGFSGAPIWDKINGYVVGMVTAITPPDRYQRMSVTAFATTTNVLIEVCPELKNVVVGTVSQPSDTKPFRYACFISFRHGKHRLIQRIINDLRDALAAELELLVNEEVYLDEERLSGDYEYDECIAEMICKSACMVVVYTGTYFDRQFTYCTREYRAMVALEEWRQQALDLPPGGENSFIIPLVFRMPGDIPNEIKERHHIHTEFVKFLMSDTEMSSHPGYAAKIREIAEYIAERCKMLCELPQPFTNCTAFKLPTDRQVTRWLDSVTGGGTQVTHTQAFVWRKDRN